MTHQYGTIDFGGKGEDVLIAYINHKYGKDFTLDDFEFSTPEFVTIPNPTHNSKVLLGPKAHTGYYGFRTVYYNRIHVSELGPIKVPYENEQYLTQVLSKINRKYGILIRAKDIFEKVLTAPNPGEELVVSLEFRPESLTFYGGDLITLGTNDPSIEFDSPINEPFANEFVLFADKSYEVDNKIYKEFNALSLARDFIRQKSTRIQNPEDTAFQKFHKTTYTQDQLNKLKDVHPFIMTWTPLDSKAIQGVNHYGDVLQLDPQSQEWTKVSNVFGLDATTNAQTLDKYKNEVYLKKGGVNHQGHIFLIKKNETEQKVQVIKSTDGVTWTDVDILEGSQQFSIYTDWKDTVIYDSVMVGSKLYMLVKGTSPYPVQEGKGVLPPAVEIFNTITGDTEIHPLGDLKFLNTPFGTKPTDNSIYKFVANSSETKSSLDVVALTALETVQKPVLVYYRFQTDKYQARQIENAHLEPDALINGFYDIAAHTKPLNKNENKYLFSIAITGRIKQDTLDLEHFLYTEDKTQDAYLSFGLTTFTTVLDNTGAGLWFKKDFSLGQGHTPKVVRLENRGRVTNYFYQPESGLYKLSYKENEDGIIDSELEQVFSAGSQPGFNEITPVAAGQFSEIKFMEYASYDNAIVAYSNEEQAKAALNYSFIAKQDDGAYRWLYAEDESQGLNYRSFSKEYAVLGFTPLVTAVMDSKIYVWSSDGQTVWFSENEGKAWKPYAQTLTYYDDYHKQYKGHAYLKLKPDNFVKGNFKNDKLIFEIKYQDQLKMVDLAQEKFDVNMTVVDNALYELTDQDPHIAQQFNSVYSARGLNVLSKDSPRKIIAWDADTDNNLLVYGQYSLNRQDPYTQWVNKNSIKEEITDEVLMVERDLGYVDIKYLVYTTTNLEEYKLQVIRSNDEITVHNLYVEGEPLNGFRPTHQWHLWDYSDQEDSYTPFVLLGHREFVLLERVDTDGNYSFTRHTLTIPDDNNGDLNVLPMFSNNRREYLLWQKGNGIFKVNYTWNKFDRVSTVSLEKIFSLAVYADLDLISGSHLLADKVEPFNEVKVPVIPPYGEVLETKCRGISKVQVRADGRLGSFEVVIEEKSTDCGYVPPQPDDIDSGGATINPGG